MRQNKKTTETHINHRETMKSPFFFHVDFPLFTVRDLELQSFNRWNERVSIFN